MIYPKEVIEKTTSWVEGSPMAKQWLQQNNYEELIQLKDAASKHTKLFLYLLVHKPLILA